MKTAEKVFNVVVIAVVMLTGAGFGTLTGLFYSAELYWWVGAITGVVISFPLARFYLRQLVKVSAKGFSRKVIWLLSTLIAVVCGLICTTAVHGIMAILVYPGDPFTTEIGNLVPTAIIVGEVVGAVAGLIVGGICSLVYVLKIRGEHREVA